MDFEKLLFRERPRGARLFWMHSLSLSMWDVGSGVWPRAPLPMSWTSSRVCVKTRYQHFLNFSFSNANLHVTSHRSLLKFRFGFSRFRWDPRFFLPSKLPGGTQAAYPGSTFSLTLRNTTFLTGVNRPEMGISFRVWLNLGYWSLQHKGRNQRVETHLERDRVYRGRMGEMWTLES